VFAKSGKQVKSNVCKQYKGTHTADIEAKLVEVFPTIRVAFKRDCSNHDFCLGLNGPVQGSMQQKLEQRHPTGIR